MQLLGGSGAVQENGSVGGDRDIQDSKPGERVVQGGRSVVALHKLDVCNTLQACGDHGGIIDSIQRRERNVQAVEVCQEQVTSVALEGHKVGVGDIDVRGDEIRLTRQRNSDGVVDGGVRGIDAQVGEGCNAEGWVRRRAARDELANE